VGANVSGRRRIIDARALFKITRRRRRRKIRKKKKKKKSKSVSSI
jgi:hypothetical protein